MSDSPQPWLVHEPPALSVQSRTAATHLVHRDSTPDITFCGKRIDEEWAMGVQNPEWSSCGECRRIWSRR